MQLHDAYLSVAEALRHAGYTLGARGDDPVDRLRDASRRATLTRSLGALDGIIVPGGFGERGIDGMILAAQYAREHRVPYFGICLGMQIAVIEYARHVAGIADADSGEFNELCTTQGHRLHARTERRDRQGRHAAAGRVSLLHPARHHHGALLRQTGASPSATATAMNSTTSTADALTGAGLTLSGLSPDGRLVETVELTDRPFFVGVQYHPEFKSRPNNAHPLFKGFIQAALEH